MGGKRWTIEEEDAIRRRFPLDGGIPSGAKLRQLAAVLDRTTNAIRKHWLIMSRGSTASDKPATRGRRWTPAEEEVLLNSFPLEGEGPHVGDVQAKELMRLLNRSFAALQSRWWLLSNGVAAKEVKPQHIPAVEHVPSTSVGHIIVEVLDLYTLVEKLRAESPAFREQLAEIAVYIAKQRGEITRENEVQVTQAIYNMMTL